MAGIKERLGSMEDNGNSGDALLEKSTSRDREIVKAGIVGITANVLLAAFKGAAGFVSGSIAVVLDAVNNLSDAAGSVITIAGTKLASKPADKKHPFGYGRVEYLSAMIISVIVLYAGITSLVESVKKILHPEKAEYTAVSLIIIAAAVAVKVALGRYTIKVGRKVNSDSLVNSGKDASLDSIISASTFVAAVIFIITGVPLEPYLGAVISLVIIKSGVEMLRETLSEILGERADASLAREIKKTVLEFEGVSGVYDLVLNNYGPDCYNGSLHIEVPDTFSAEMIDSLTRKISLEVFKKHNVILTAISVYSVNTKNPAVVAAREKIRKLVFSEPFVIQMHGFFIDEEEKKIRFDLVVSFSSPDRLATYKNAVEKVRKEFSGYKIEAVMDTDFSESE